MKLLKKTYSEINSPHVKNILRQLKVSIGGNN